MINSIQKAGDADEDNLTAKAVHMKNSAMIVYLDRINYFHPPAKSGGSMASRRAWKKARLTRRISK